MGNARPGTSGRRARYLTAAIVFIALAALAYGLAPDIRRVLVVRAETATREAPLVVDPAYEAPFLAALPEHATLGPNGIRFLALPSLSHTSYGLFLKAENDGGASGEFIVFRHSATAPTQLIHHPIRIPEMPYRDFLKAIDDSADGYWGSAQMCLDGTGILFERIRGSRVTSGNGNYCTAHYERISMIVLNFVRQNVASPDLPRESSWWLPPVQAPRPAPALRRTRDPSAAPSALQASAPTGSRS